MYDTNVSHFATRKHVKYRKAK